MSEIIPMVPTGIPGLDEMIDGGFPEGRVVLIIGGPGAGKTILASQFLYKGITECNENGVIVSIDEKPKQYFQEMMKFGWDFKKAEQEGKFGFIDATRLSRVMMLKEKFEKKESSSIRGKQLQVDEVIQKLQAKIDEINAKRVVLDTLASLFYRFTRRTERRTAGVDLIEALSDLGTTVLVTTELEELGLKRKVMIEEFLVQGVIMMQTLFIGESTARGLQVEKMRGVNVDTSLVPYTIDRDGVEVYPGTPLSRK